MPTIRYRRFSVAAAATILVVLAGCRQQEVVTFAENAGWCWFQDERVLIHDGRLIIGSIAGAAPDSGDVKVTTFDLERDEHVGTFVLHENFEQDDHDVPAFYVRPDERVLSVYQKHYEQDSSRIYYRISKPNNTMNWEAEQTISRGDSNAVTYANLYYLPAEGRLYNFFRDGPTFQPTYIYSTDHGSTWTTGRKLIDDGLEERNRPYVRYCSNYLDTIYLSFTEAHPRNLETSIYFAAFRGGTFYHVDGTLIKDLEQDGPLTPQEATRIYAGGGEAGRAWTSSIRLDPEGRPVIAYSVHLGGDDHRYRYARWDGRRWHDHEIAFAGDNLYPEEEDYTGLVTVDPSNVDVVYLSSDVDPETGDSVGTGAYEIYRGATTDFGATWHFEAITSNSQADNIRPIVPPSEGDYRAVLWMRGDYRTYTDYDTDIVGFYETMR